MITWIIESDKDRVHAGGIAIYALCDPRTGATRYVGLVKDPEQRYRAHLAMRDARVNPWKARWIAGLLREGVEPEMEIILVVPRAKAFATERMVIAEYSTDNHLFNIVVPPEHLNRLRSGMAGDESVRVGIDE